MAQNIIQPISQNLWWVIPGKLAGVRQPLPAELSELQTAGIGAIVSVLEDRANLNIYQTAGISYLWLPVKAGMAPNREQVREFQSFVEQQNQLGQGVAVHCTGGRHRTGTMLAAYLISTGSSYEFSLQRIINVNPEAELEITQNVFLRSLAGENIS
jgi:atypical dual specificity phosphatase